MEAIGVELNTKATTASRKGGGPAYPNVLKGVTERAKQTGS